MSTFEESEWNQQIFGYEDQCTRRIECYTCKKDIMNGEMYIRAPRLFYESSRGHHTICYLVELKKAVDMLNNRGLSMRSLQ